MARWMQVLAVAGVMVVGLAGPVVAATRVAATDLDAAPQAIDPKQRDKFLLPFGKRLWRPIKGAAIASLSDDQMAVVGLNEATRIYARAGGGGGPRGDWKPGEVFIRVAPGKYLALEPLDQPLTPPPPLGPAPKPQTNPAPATQR